jgi:hypothetical protein
MTEATLLWGLGGEACREPPGQGAQHIRCPACGQPRPGRESGQRAGKNFCELPLCTLCADSRGREVLICVIFAAFSKRFPQGEFLRFFNFVFWVCKFYGSSLCLYVHDITRLYLSCLLSSKIFLHILGFCFCGFFKS